MDFLVKLFRRDRYIEDRAQKMDPNEEMRRFHDRFDLYLRQELSYEQLHVDSVENRHKVEVSQLRQEIERLKGKLASCTCKK